MFCAVVLLAEPGASSPCRISVSQPKTAGKSPVRFLTSDLVPSAPVNVRPYDVVCWWPKRMPSPRTSSR